MLWRHHLTQDSFRFTSLLIDVHSWLRIQTCVYLLVWFICNWPAMNRWFEIKSCWPLCDPDLGKKWVLKMDGWIDEWMNGSFPLWFRHRDQMSQLQFRLDEDTLKKKKNQINPDSKCVRLCGEAVTVQTCRTPKVKPGSPFRVAASCVTLRLPITCHVKWKQALSGSDISLLNPPGVVGGIWWLFPIHATFFFPSLSSSQGAVFTGEDQFTNLRLAFVT